MKLYLSLLGNSSSLTNFILILFLSGRFKSQYLVTLAICKSAKSVLEINTLWTSTLIIVNFFKTFSTYISANKSPTQKFKHSPEPFEAKNDYNFEKIYEKNGKLYLKSINYKNEFDKFFTQVNRIKKQKRKTRQSLKNILLPKNGRSLDKENDFFFNLNLKMAHISKGILLLDEKKNYINEEEEKINKNDNNNNFNLNNFPEIHNLHKL